MLTVMCMQLVLDMHAWVKDVLSVAMIRYAQEQ